MDDFIHEIDLILYALDEVTVKGEQNHRYILAAQQHLHDMREVMKSRMMEEKRNAAKDKQE